MNKKRKVKRSFQWENSEDLAKVNLPIITRGAWIYLSWIGGRVNQLVTHAPVCCAREMWMGETESQDSECDTIVVGQSTVSFGIL